MSFRTGAEPKNWRPLIVCLAITLFELSMISARASQTKMPGPEPWIVAAQMLRNGEYDARGIYLSPGLIITAAHLTAITTASDIISVRIANAALPATLLKKGEFEDVDLALFSLDQQKLPERIGQIQMPLCAAAPPNEGEPWQSRSLLSPPAYRAQRICRFCSREPTRPRKSLTDLP